jgi:hypothetical protein
MDDPMNVSYQITYQMRHVFDFGFELVVRFILAD